MLFRAGAIALAAVCLSGAVSADDFDWGVGGSDSGEAAKAESAGASTAPAAAGTQSAENYEPLGFWEVLPSHFVVSKPSYVRCPVTGKSSRPELYMCWPFSFKNTISLSRVLDHYKAQLERKEVQDDQYLAESLRQTVARLENDLKDGERSFRLYVTLHTNTGKVYHDISDPIIASVYSNNAKSKRETVRQLAGRTVKKDESVEGVAVFSEIDPEADSFEIRVLGLGKRVVPSYCPGDLLQADTQYNPRLRKSLRFFYERLGDGSNRESEPINFLSRKAEWIWMWSGEIYPKEAHSFQVSRSSGLSFEYLWFPYEVYNSTTVPQKLEVMRAGLAPKVKWHGIPLVVTMDEPAKDDEYWKLQASELAMKEVLDLAQKGELGLTIDASSLRHVNKEIPGNAKATGLAVVKWGVANVPELMDEIVSRLEVKGFTSGSTGTTDELIDAYSKMRKPETGKEPIWSRPALPSKTEIKKLVLDQAAKENQAAGVEPTEQEKRIHGDLAPLASLINRLAKAELEQEKEGKCLSVAFQAKWNDMVDTARFTKLYALKANISFVMDKRIAQTIDTSATIVDEKKPVDVAKPEENGKPKETQDSIW